MPPSTEVLQQLSDFASGKTPVPEFEQQLYNDPDIETLLSAESAPRFCQMGTTLFHYLIGLDLSDPGHVLNAQDVLVSLLQKHGVTTALAGAATAEYALLLDAQPRWLDADVKFLASLLDAAPPLPSKQRKAWLRQRILELFKYAKQPRAGCSLQRGPSEMLALWSSWGSFLWPTTFMTRRRCMFSMTRRRTRSQHSFSSAELAA